MSDPFESIPAKDWPDIDKLIDTALEEDVGTGDVTTLWSVRRDQMAKADLISRGEGVVAGIQIAARVFQRVDPRIGFAPHVQDGDAVGVDHLIAEVSGPSRGILTAERTAINFLQRMSGIATATSACVKAVVGTRTKILDTRKTAPGLRMLDKYAVRAGGGVNHRAGLFDMVLIKDNHIEAADGIASAIHRVRAGMAKANRSLKVEVEVKNLDELREALACQVDRVMLDNVDPDTIKQAVYLVHEIQDGPEIEVSGGITLDSIGMISQTCVDFISVGALTHSVPALDVSLQFRSR